MWETQERSGGIEKSLRGEQACDRPIIGKFICVKNGIQFQLRSLKIVRVSDLFLVLSTAVLFIYVFNSHQVLRVNSVYRCKQENLSLALRCFHGSTASDISLLEQFE